jgi:hypothetical protein
VSGGRSGESKMRAKGGGVAGQVSFIEGESGGSPSLDWPRWVAAHLVIGLGGRQSL